MPKRQTPTGRVVADSPVIQNFPVRTPDGTAIKQAFTGSPPLGETPEGYCREIQRRAAQLMFSVVITRPVRNVTLFEFWKPSRGRIAGPLTRAEAEAWLDGYLAAHGVFR